MAETGWAERRGRMVKCKIHGLHYDPEMSTGCTRCLREAAKALPKRPPQLVLILLCLLGMAAILFYLFGPGRPEAAPVVDLGVATSPVSDPKLEPEPYRTRIETLEGALFETRLDETADLLIVSADVRTAADDLSAQILSAEPVVGLTAADSIARMGQAIPLDQVTASDVERARQQWLQIREQRFLSADWFASPSAATEEAESSVAGYSDVAASLRAQIENAAAEAEAWGDPLAAAPGGDDPALRWRSFARDWQQDIRSLQIRLPPRPGVRASSELLIAVQDLEQAIRLAQALASSTEPPAPSDSRFDEAINAALRAQQSFDALAS